MNSASPIAPCWAVLVNAGTLVEEPASPELVCVTKSRDGKRAYVQYKGEAEYEREL